MGVTDGPVVFFDEMVEFGEKEWEAAKTLLAHLAARTEKGCWSAHHYFPIDQIVIPPEEKSK